MLTANNRIVFFGDSITDAGRDRNTTAANTGLGSGYAMLATSQLLANYAEWNLQLWNKGIGGNRITDLEARLDSDVLALQPDIVSILIGINDVWRRYDSGVESKLNEFEASYRRVLEKLGDAGAQVLMLEPFLLPVPEDRRAWREDLNPKIDVCRDLAREFECVYVPLDGLFAQASARRESAFWLPDGVHPSLAGHALIASYWLESLES